MFNPYGDRPIISNREADLSDVEVDEPLSMQEIAKLVPVFFAAASKQSAYNAARGMQHIPTEKLLKRLYEVLFLCGHLHEANLVNSHLARLRLPAKYGGKELVLSRALMDPELRALFRGQKGNRDAEELSRRASGIWEHRNPAAATRYWLIRAQEEAEAGHAHVAKELTKLAYSKCGFEMLAPAVTAPIVQIDVGGRKPRSTKQSTMDAQNFLQAFELYMQDLDGRAWEEAEKDFANDHEIKVKVLQSRIRRAQIARAKSGL